MYTKKQLEIKLSRLKIGNHLISGYEQYPTDSSNSAWIVFKATLDGNVYGKNVIDLGTGNGIFAIGAHLMGAASVNGIDMDATQINIARENSLGMGLNFETMDVVDVKGKFDTAFMNPPFGSVNPHADVPFLSKALEVASCIYSVHNIKSSEFVRSFYESRAEIVYTEKISLKIPRLYRHHTHVLQIIPAVFYVVKNER
ncbi:ribosomal protein L11 methyltransferase [Thermoplasmatales archaeon]|nr:ribosomal protein L11 methyltransferase [Thermoplasmatales archaeon]